MATEYSLGGVGDEEADGARAWGGGKKQAEQVGGTGRGREGRRSERGGKRGLAWGCAVAGRSPRLVTPLGRVRVALDIICLVPYQCLLACAPPLVSATCCAPIRSHVGRCSCATD